MTFFFGVLARIIITVFCDVGFVVSVVVVVGGDGVVVGIGVFGTVIKIMKWTCFKWKPNLTQTPDNFQ